MKKWMQRWISLTLALCMLAATALGEGRFVLPASLKVIEEQAFYGDTSVDEVIVQEGTEEIGSQAFAQSSLSAITLPGSVTSIADDAFDGCGRIEVNVQEGTYAYDWAMKRDMIDVVTPTPTEYFTYTIENGECTITGNTGRYEEEVVIPEMIDGAKVTAIGDWAFCAVQPLRSVVLPSGVTYIGDYAFCNCLWLSDVNIPAGVTYIGDRAFCYCDIGTITIPASVVHIGSMAFTGNWRITCFAVEEGNEKYTSIDAVLFDKNVETLLAYPPSKDAEKYAIPQSVKHIADGAFLLAGSLKEITLPDNLNDIGGEAFKYCPNLSSITIPKSVTNIGGWAFELCTNLKSIMLPERLSSISEGIFWGCDSLENVVIPASVTSIGAMAFGSCENLTSVTVPESVTSIDADTFYESPNVTATVVENSPAHTWCVENNVKYVLAE